MLLSSFDLRIKGITESVAEKVESKNCDKDYQTREIHHMRRHVQVASALGEHCLYQLANKREIAKIQDEFYQIYKAEDLDQLRRFQKQLDVIAEGYRAQSC